MYTKCVDGYSNVKYCILPQNVIDVEGKCVILEPERAKTLVNDDNNVEDIC